MVPVEPRVTPWRKLRYERIWHQRTPTCCWCYPWTQPLEKKKTRRARATFDTFLISKCTVEIHTVSTACLQFKNDSQVWCFLGSLLQTRNRWIWKHSCGTTCCCWSPSESRKQHAQTIHRMDVFQRSRQNWNDFLNDAEIVRDSKSTNPPSQSFEASSCSIFGYLWLRSSRGESCGASLRDWTTGGSGAPCVERNKTRSHCISCQKKNCTNFL